MRGQTPAAAPSIWRNADFARLWLAGGVSGLGARITREGLPLMAVLLLHVSPREIGLLAALRAAPSLLVGLLCGRWVDRTQRRRILVGADLARALLLLVVPAAALAHHLAMGEIYLAAACVGGLSTLYDMADHAYLPSLVPREGLVSANAALGGMESVAEIGGPALAGVLFSVLTAPIAIAVNSLTYAVSAIILVGIRRAEEPAVAPDDDTPRRLVLSETVGLAWGSNITRPLLLLVLTYGLFGSFFSALYIPYAVGTLRLTPAMLGATISVGGVGALVGAGLAPRMARRLGVGHALILSGALNGVFNILIPLAGGSPSRGMLILMSAQLLGDAAGTAMFIYISSLRQGLLSPQVLGRIAGVFAAAAGLAAILGALGGGWLGEAIGVRGAMLMACAGMAFAPAWCLTAPIRQTRSLPASQATP